MSVIMLLCLLLLCLLLCYYVWHYVIMSGIMLLCLLLCYYVWHYVIMSGIMLLCYYVFCYYVIMSLKGYYVFKKDILSSKKTLPPLILSKRKGGAATLRPRPIVMLRNAPYFTRAFFVVPSAYFTMIIWPLSGISMRLPFMSK